MRVAVVGTGYVGATVGICLAEADNNVTCIDVDAKKIKALQHGELPLHEPGLDELFQRGLREGRLGFTTSYVNGLAGAEVVFIAVGTPPAPDGSADLSYIKQAAAEIAKHVEPYAVVAMKSTVPVGTGDVVSHQLQEALDDGDLAVVSCPEFLKEGTAVEDMMKPDRVVIGGGSARAVRVMEELFAPFVRTGAPILKMDRRSAELTKYAANAMLALRISFMNDIAALCDGVNADVEHVRRGIGADKRIGNSFLFPGVGFGGSCFGKDINALTSTARAAGLSFEILRAAERVNTRQKNLLVERVMEFFKPNINQARIAIWGATFKPHTDDMRDAPALTIIDGLIAAGVAGIAVHDPVAGAFLDKRYGAKVRLPKEPYDTAIGVDALLLVTEWPEYRSPDFERLARVMRPGADGARRLLLDGRNAWDPHKATAAGFYYRGVGRR